MYCSTIITITSSKHTPSLASNKHGCTHRRMLACILYWNQELIPRKRLGYWKSVEQVVCPSKGKLGLRACGCSHRSMFARAWCVAREISVLEAAMVLRRTWQVWSLGEDVQQPSSSQQNKQSRRECDRGCGAASSPELFPEVIFG